MQQDIGISDAVYGLGAGIFFLGYVMFEVPSNLLLTRIGARRTISRIMVLWGLTSASMLFVQGEWSFYVLRFMLGVFEAGFAPGMIFYLTYWYSQSRMAGVMAVVMLAGPIGGIVGGPVSAWIMTAFSGAHGLDGWQWMFLLEGLPCVLLGVIAFRYLDDKPAEARWLSAEEKALLAADLDSRGAHKKHAFAQVLRDPAIYGMALTYFCLICGIYAVSFWLPTLLKLAGCRTPCRSACTRRSPTWPRRSSCCGSRAAPTACANAAGTRWCPPCWPAWRCASPPRRRRNSRYP